MVYLEPALARDAPRRWPARHIPTAWLIALLALATCVTRAAPFGSPVAHVDDEFYLLVGTVMLDGGWPYVDIWDRKPVGLFALYAAIAAVAGENAMIGVQLVAGLFALGTALIVADIGKRLSSDWGGLLAGILYLLAITTVGGKTGQSPVFYNLLVAGAAWLWVDSLGKVGARPIVRRALAAMLLLGLAMSIKQISFIEGGFIGLAFLWRFVRAGFSRGRIAAWAAAMIAVALAPTALALAIYAAAGHADAFIFANFVSIFLKRPVGGEALSRGLEQLVLFVLPMVALGAWGAWARRRALRDPLHLFMIGWMAFAIVGYLFIPNFYDHYALPMMVPLSISAATLFAMSRGWLLFVPLTAMAAAEGGTFSIDSQQRRTAAAATLSAVIERELRGGCLFLVAGRTHFYLSTPACRPSKFVFPDHLNDSAEVDGIGIDQLTEVKRIFATRPTVVVTDGRNDWRRTPRVKAFVDAELARDYRMVFKLPGTKPRNMVELRIWSRIAR